MVGRIGGDGVGVGFGGTGETDGHSYRILHVHRFQCMRGNEGKSPVPHRFIERQYDVVPLETTPTRMHAFATQEILIRGFPDWSLD